MADHVAEWGGAERTFRLRLSDLMDLEEACGKVGFGAIYMRVARHGFFVQDIYHTIRLGLIGGGMAPDEAKRLMRDRFDATPVARSVQLALNLLLATMEGIPADETKAPADPSRPMDRGAIMASFLKLGMTPDQLRAMRYDDFVLAMRAMGGSTVQPPTEDEFVDMVRRLAPDLAD